MDKIDLLLNLRSWVAEAIATAGGQVTTRAIGVAADEVHLGFELNGQSVRLTIMPE
jgi:hypothetical protein